MECRPIRRTRRSLWVAVLNVAALGFAEGMPLALAQLPAQPPTRPAPRPRNRPGAAKPPVQPPQTDEAKSPADVAAETPKEAEQQPTPPQPTPPRPVRSTPGKTAEPSDQAAKPITPDYVVDPPSGTVAQPQPQPPPTAEAQKKPDGSEMDPAKRMEEARKAAAERAAARRARNVQGADTTGKTTAGQPAPGAKRLPMGGGSAVATPSSGETTGQFVPDDGPTTPINIAPAESDVPPEARMYGFSIKDGTYEQLIEGFARQTGLGVIGDAPEDGKVTFVSTETLTFEQALGRVRMLLFRYKPHEPYWIVRNEMNLEVSKVNDIYRVLPRNRMFRSVEEFLEAGLSRDELALVVYTPKSGSVADLKQVRDWLPDYVRVTPLEDQNSVTIFALVSDIEKYLGLIDFIRGTRTDPRTLQKIEIHHLLASDALNRLRQLMDIDGAPPGRPAAVNPRRATREPSALDSMPEAPITVIADDAQGILLVRAMQVKIDEIMLLLPFIDVDMSAQSPAPVVVKLQYVESHEMITTLQQILSASPTPPGSPTPPKTRKGKRSTRGPVAAPGSPGAGTASEGITLLPHPSDNAIIVLADEEGVARVRELVTLFDVSTMMQPVRIPLAHADANEVLNIVTVVLGAAGRAGQPAFDRFTLVVDPSGVAMWFSGNDQDLARVKDVIATIDIAEEPVSLRVVLLKHQQPTFVSNMLREFDGSIATSAMPAPAGRKPKRRRAAPVQTSKFTPDDSTNRLFILCTGDEWARYEPLIEQLDRPTDDGEVFVRLPLQHAEPNAAIDRLGAMLPDEEGVRFLASEGSILVVGAKPEQLERIKVFVGEVDKPSHVEQRTFEIRYANPADVKSAIESLIANMPVKAPQKPRKGGAGKSVPGMEATVSDQLTIVQFGQRLVVQTTAARMEQVAALVAEFDVEEAKTELKVYADFPTGTNIEVISETVSSVFTAMGRGGSPKRSGRVGAAVEGPRFIPQPASGRLVVIAEPTLFPEIERLLTVLRHEVESRPTVVVFVEVKYADPAELVESVKPLLDIKVRGLLESGELDEAGEEGATAPKLSKRRLALTQSSSDRYHLSPDPRNHRIVIAAPMVVVEQAKTLIAQFDTPSEKPVFKTVELANASPDDMVRAVREMLGRPVARKVSSPGKGKSPATPAVDLGGGDGLSVVEAPGGGAVILHGLAAEVAEAEEWIKRLDEMSTRGRTIKVYEIKNADMTKLFDMVVHVVGSSSAAAGGKGGQQVPRGGGRSGDSKDDAAEEFTTSKTFAGAELYIQADLIGKTMLVATTPARVSEIDDIVAQLDENEQIVAVMKSDPPVPRMTYDLKEADASDAKWALQDALETMWEPRDVLPQVDGFGNVLIVRYPHEDRFDDIREFIRTYADKPDPEKTKIVARSFPAPAGLSAQEAAVWIKLNHPEIMVDLEDTTPGNDKPYEIIRIRPPPPKRAHPCVLPGTFRRTTDALLGGIAGRLQPEPEDQPIEDEETFEDEPEEEFVPIPTGDDMIRQVFTPIPPRKSSKKTAVRESGESDSREPSRDKSTEKTDDRERARGEKIEIEYDNVAGVFVVKGRKSDVEEVDEWIDELKDGIEDFPVKADIRIYQVRYIDVFSAQDILEEMFNATKQQQQMIQRQQQQLLRQQQLQQRLGQGQGQQPAGKGQQPEQGAPGGAAGPGGRLAQQQALQAQAAAAQLPQSSVRIYPNPRDRTLILRAETSQYPQIEELLATIDQPKPIDSFMRTYALKNLNATEVEEILREMLGISREGGRSKGATAKTPGVAGLPGPSVSPSEQLPQTILQETVTGASQLNIDPADIKLFSSEVSNTVMAMAPKKALDFIGELIQKLESEDIPQRTIKYYELKHADVEDAAAYLESHFEEASGPRKIRRGGGDAAASGPGGKSLNAPSFVAYPRLNFLTVQATAVQIEEIDRIVARIDVSGGTDKWEDVALAHADAKLVADTLTQMFADKGGGAAGQSKATTKGAPIPKFIGEVGGGIVLFNAPASLREQVLATVAKLEEQYKETRTPRIIELKNAKPSALAEAIEEAYNAKKAAGRSGGPMPPRFTVTAHDPTKRLFVIADDETFKEVEALVRLLDDKPGSIGVEFRIYPLQYASAKSVHAQMTKLLKDYLSRLGQGANTIDAFSVEPDELSNSLIVLGGPTVFGFLEENLRKVDTPEMKTSQPASLIVPLNAANASEVAQNIKSLYAAREQPLGVTAPQVEANSATNALIVRGTQAQIDEIKKDIIDPLEAQIGTDRQVQVKPIKLTFADPGSVQDAVTKLFRSDSRNPRDQVSAVSEYTSNSLIVSASPENLKRVEALIAQIDNAETSQLDVHVVEIKHADAASVAQTLTEIFVRSAAKQVGNQAPPITISAVAGSRALLIKCKGEDFARIEETIKELDTEVVGTGGEVRVVTLLYGDAAEINTAMQEYLRKPGGAGGRGDLVGGVRLSAMAQSNSLMVSGAKEEVDRLESIIHGMDVAGEKGSVPQIIALKYANVGMILPSVQEVFSESRGGGRRNQPAPIIVADEGSNALIVRASPTDLTAIQGIVDQLDTEDKKDKTPFRIIKVAAGINVTDLAEQVEMTLNESAQATAGSGRGVRVPSVTVTPNVRTNSLVVSGYAAMFDQAESLVRKLEEMGPAGNVSTRIVRVGNIKVDQIQKMIDQLTQQPGGRESGRGGGRTRPSSRPRSGP